MNLLQRAACAIAYSIKGSPGDVSAEGNPLPPCPETPNCYRTTVEVSKSAEELYIKTKEVVSKEAKLKIENKEEFRLEAVYTIPVFQYKDDLIIQIESVDGQNSKLHFRSSSRVGVGDLGVNRSRVLSIIKKVT